MPDNLGSHKGKAVRQAIRKAGAHLLFLPPYSPDLTLRPPSNDAAHRRNLVGRLRPIEQMFSKVKTPLRKADERSVDATWKRIGSLLDRFSPDKCGNYLVNSGYAAT